MATVFGKQLKTIQNRIFSLFYKLIEISLISDVKPKGKTELDIQNLKKNKCSIVDIAANFVITVLYMYTPQLYFYFCNVSGS